MARSIPRPASAPAWAPVAAVVAGIATFSAMDAAIKAASMLTGVYTALLVRNMLGTAMTLPFWLATRPALPSARVLALHVLRSAVNAGMALLFFVSLLHIPMAEAVALSFIAPLIALYLAAVILKEAIRPQAIGASLLGLAGVAVIVGGRIGNGSADARSMLGVAAVLASAVLYAINLVLQRKQALLAKPAEITLFQNLVISAILLVFAPAFVAPVSGHALGLIAAGAALATVALSLLAWGYARAEAQILLPIEYTAFIWAALLGWWCFAEPLGVATLAGTCLIVLGCWIGTRAAPQGPPHTEQTLV